MTVPQKLHQIRQRNRVARKRVEPVPPHQELHRRGHAGRVRAVRVRDHGHGELPVPQRLPAAAARAARARRLPVSG